MSHHLVPQHDQGDYVDVRMRCSRVIFVGFVTALALSIFYGPVPYSQARE